MSKESPLKRKVIIISSVILIVLVVLLGLALAYVNVPYTVVEVYYEEVPYEDIEYYNETVERTVRVPRREMETSTSTVKIVRTLDHRISPEPTFYRNRDCYFDDYNYTISYITAPQNEYDFDWRTETGYRKNKLVIGVEICNNEKRRMNAEFKICNMYGDRVADCQDTLDTRVRARTCEIDRLIWWTTFDVKKTIRIVPQLISKKLVCRSSVVEFGADLPLYTTVSLAPEQWFIDNLERSGDILYPGGEIMKTESGYLGIPKKRNTGPADYVVTEEITRTRPVTKYYDEIETDIVQQQRTVTRYSTVERTREITEHRTLFEELLFRLGW